jgi:Holliday junction DNA helicase RuvB
MNEETTIEDKTLEADPEEERFLDDLRPRTVKDYIGQEHVVGNIIIGLEAAKKRSEPIEHTILHGPPGLGKTTLAHIIANEMGTQIRVTSGPAIERAGDLASILTNLEEGGILFIDEIHRLNRNIEEVLYPAMEDFAIDLILGKGPSAKTMRIDLPRFTLIGATTRVGSLSSPLRDRFGLAFRLDYYQEKDLVKIIKRSAKTLNITTDEDAIEEIAKRARKTPRIANKILKRVRDYAQVKHQGKVTKKIANDALISLEIDGLGLDRVDREYLATVIKKFSGGPVGVETISAAISEDRETIEDVIEPYLIQIGFLNRTRQGRVATGAAHGHMGIKIKDQNPKLL